MYTLDIETIASPKPSGIFKKQLVSTIKGMRNGTGTEKEYLIGVLPSLNFPLEEQEFQLISQHVRPEVLEVVENKIKEIDTNNALDKRYNQIVCICLFDGKEKHVAYDNNEKELLKAFFDIFNIKLIPPIDIIGWNTEHFDIPIIEFACYRNGMLPEANWTREVLLKQHRDLFWMFNNRYSRGNEKWDYTDPNHWVNLKDACELFNISHLQKETGKDIQTMYNEGNTDGIINKCTNDVVSLYALAEKFIIEACIKCIV